MARQQVIASLQELVVGWHVRTILVVDLIPRRALLMDVGRRPRGGVIGNVKADRDFQLGALFPKQIEARVIQMHPPFAWEPGRVARSGDDATDDSPSLVG